jgi:ABC-type glycerol-3-phosphate transport system substrate-binding protein
MRFKATLWSASAAVGLVLGQAALAADTVVFWQFSTRDADIAAWNEAIASFEAANPEIDVEMEIVPWAEQQQRLVTALTTGGLPDVSMLGNNVVAQFQAAGALAPLDEYFAAYGEEHGYDVAADVWPGDKGYYNLDGKWWASPVIVETRALYYRKDLMEQAGLDPNQPPRTWEELIDAAAKITEATDTYGWAAPMSLDYFTVQNFMSTYLSHGARMLNDQGQCGFDTPEFRQALEIYTSAYERGVTHPDAPSMPGQAFRRGFLDGNFAMIIDSPNIAKDIENENPEWADQIGIAMVPEGPEGRAGFLGGWPLLLWNESEVKDAAAKWIMYATRPEGALRQISEVSGAIPGSIKLAAEAPWNAAPYALFVEQLQDARPYQYPDQAIPQMGQLEVDTIQKAIQAVALDQATVEEATTQLCADINAVLAR